MERQPNQQRMGQPGMNPNQPPFMPNGPGWGPQPAQMDRQRRVELPRFWTYDALGWFQLAENTFRRFDVRDSFYKFDLVLPTLSEETSVQVRSIFGTWTRCLTPTTR